MPIESSISAPESCAETCAKQRDRNDFGPDQILYIGARRLWEQGPKPIQHLGLQQDRVLYIGAGPFRKLVAISASGAVPLDECIVPTTVLAEVTRMGFQPLLRLHVPAGKVPGVTLGATRPDWPSSVRPGTPASSRQSAETSAASSGRRGSHRSGNVGGGEEKERPSVHRVGLVNPP